MPGWQLEERVESRSPLSLPLDRGRELYVMNRKKGTESRHRAFSSAAVGSPIHPGPVFLVSATRPLHLSLNRTEVTLHDGTVARYRPAAPFSLRNPWTFIPVARVAFKRGRRSSLAFTLIAIVTNNTVRCREDSRGIRNTSVEARFLHGEN